ncbi:MULTISPECIES: WYL domain-containing protein [unclassified Mammaliicoccus]|uniref:WYL domain-containing protein n=1 Tax=unclassified Mammaliicoccus TaxID=2803851 RepID=UPI001EFC19C4|nr:MULTISPECIES: WYL domain-containing protein [unclassified Mammaliicoccus]
MDKATRVLTLLTRLLNDDVVNTFEFSRIAGVSSKSIQRDINDLNNFFYESDYWNNKHTKVVYSRNLDGYQLSNGSYSKNSLALLSLLITIKSLTPILHNNVYNLFLDEISKNRLEDKFVLKSILNHFNIRPDILPGEHLMTLQKSIAKKLMVRITLDKKIVIKPLSLIYMHYDYWFTYEYQNNIYTIKVRDILDIRLLESKFDEAKNNKPFKFEIDKSIWKQFEQQYSIQKILKNEGNKIITEVSCTDLDAYYIAYQLAPLARMLAPKSYINSFIDRLETIKGLYS